MFHGRPRPQYFGLGERGLGEREYILSSQGDLSANDFGHVYSSHSADLHESEDVDFERLRECDMREVPRSLDRCDKSFRRDLVNAYYKHRCHDGSSNYWNTEYNEHMHRKAQKEWSHSELDAPCDDSPSDEHRCSNNKDRYAYFNDLNSEKLRGWGCNSSIESPPRRWECNASNESPPRGSGRNFSNDSPPRGWRGTAFNLRSPNGWSGNSVESPPRCWSRIDPNESPLRSRRRIASDESLPNDWRNCVFDEGSMRCDRFHERCYGSKPTDLMDIDLNEKYDRDARDIFDTPPAFMKYQRHQSIDHQRYNGETRYYENYSFYEKEHHERERQSFVDYHFLRSQNHTEDYRRSEREWDYKCYGHYMPSVRGRYYDHRYDDFESYSMNHDNPSKQYNADGLDERHAKQHRFRDHRSSRTLDAKFIEEPLDDREICVKSTRRNISPPQKRKIPMYELNKKRQKTNHSRRKFSTIRNQCKTPTSLLSRKHFMSRDVFTSSFKADDSLCKPRPLRDLREEINESWESRNASPEPTKALNLESQDVRHDINKSPFEGNSSVQVSWNHYVDHGNEKKFASNYGKHKDDNTLFGEQLEKEQIDACSVSASEQLHSSSIMCETLKRQVTVYDGRASSTTLSTSEKPQSDDLHLIIASRRHKNNDEAVASREKESSGPIQQSSYKGLIEVVDLAYTDEATEDEDSKLTPSSSKSRTIVLERKEKGNTKRSEPSSILSEHNSQSTNNPMESHVSTKDFEKHERAASDLTNEEKEMKRKSEKEKPLKAIVHVNNDNLCQKNEIAKISTEGQDLGDCKVDADDVVKQSTSVCCSNGGGSTHLSMVDDLNPKECLILGKHSNVNSTLQELTSESIHSSSLMRSSHFPISKLASPGSIITYDGHSSPSLSSSDVVTLALTSGGSLATQYANIKNKCNRYCHQIEANVKGSRLVQGEQGLSYNGVCEKEDTIFGPPEFDDEELDDSFAHEFQFQSTSTSAIESINLNDCAKCKEDENESKYESSIIPSSVTKIDFLLKNGDFPKSVSSIGCHAEIITKTDSRSYFNNPKIQNKRRYHPDGNKTDFLPSENIVQEQTKSIRSDSNISIKSLSVSDDHDQQDQNSSTMSKCDPAFPTKSDSLLADNDNPEQNTSIVAEYDSAVPTKNDSPIGNNDHQDQNSSAISECAPVATSHCDSLLDDNDQQDRNSCYTSDCDQEFVFKRSTLLGDNDQRDQNSSTMSECDPVANFHSRESLLDDNDQKGQNSSDCNSGDNDQQKQNSSATSHLGNNGRQNQISSTTSECVAKTASRCDSLSGDNDQKSSIMSEYDPAAPTKSVSLLRDIDHQEKSSSATSEHDPKVASRDDFLLDGHDKQDKSSGVTVGCDLEVAFRCDSLSSDNDQKDQKSSDFDREVASRSDLLSCSNDQRDQNSSTMSFYEPAVPTKSGLLLGDNDQLDQNCSVTNECDPEVASRRGSLSDDNDQQEQNSSATSVCDLKVVSCCHSILGDDVQRDQRSSVVSGYDVEVCTKRVSAGVDNNERNRSATPEYDIQVVTNCRLAKQNNSVLSNHNTEACSKEYCFVINNSQREYSEINSPSCNPEVVTKGKFSFRDEDESGQKFAAKFDKCDFCTDTTDLLTYVENRVLCCIGQSTSKIVVDTDCTKAANLISTTSDQTIVEPNNEVDTSSSEGESQIYAVLQGNLKNDGHQDLIFGSGRGSDDVPLSHTCPSKCHRKVLLIDSIAKNDQTKWMDFSSRAFCIQSKQVDNILDKCAIEQSSVEPKLNDGVSVDYFREFSIKSIDSKTSFVSCTKTANFLPDFNNNINLDMDKKSEINQYYGNKNSEMGVGSVGEMPPVNPSKMSSTSNNYTEKEGEVKEDVLSSSDTYQSQFENPKAPLTNVPDIFPSSQIAGPPLSNSTGYKHDSEVVKDAPKANYVKDAKPSTRSFSSSNYKDKGASRDVLVVEDIEPVLEDKNSVHALLDEGHDLLELAFEESVKSHTLSCIAPQRTGTTSNFKRLSLEGDLADLKGVADFDSNKCEAFIANSRNSVNKNQEQNYKRKDLIEWKQGNDEDIADHSSKMLSERVGNSPCGESFLGPSAKANTKNVHVLIGFDSTNPSTYNEGSTNKSKPEKNRPPILHQDPTSLLISVPSGEKKTEMSLDEFVDAQLKKGIGMHFSSSLSSAVPRYSMLFSKSAYEKSCQNSSIKELAIYEYQPANANMSAVNCRVWSEMKKDNHVECKSNNDTKSLNVYKQKIFAILQKRVDIEKEYRDECESVLYAIKSLARKTDSTEEDLKAMLLTRLRDVSKKYVSKLESFVRSENYYNN